MTSDQIIIQKLIVHKVDHKNRSEPVLSEEVSPFSKDISNFLKAQIIINREHSHTREGVFIGNVDDQSHFRNLCDELQKPHGRFVPKSQEIASHLFNAINFDKRISPGDLVICTFLDGSSNGAPWLALMKMDPQDSFISREEVHEGKRRIVLKYLNNVLPIGELQKCAFILPQPLRTQYRDLLVLDQQSGSYGAPRPVASFFSSKFLECRIELLESEKTKIFYLKGLDWVNPKKGVWPEDEIIRFKEHLLAALKGHIIDVEAFAKIAIKDIAEQEDYIRWMQDKLPYAMVFKPDSTFLSTEEYTIIEGDNDLRIRIKASAVGPDKTLSYKLNKATGVHTITIKTAHWYSENKREIR